ncbi:MAG: C69 family dipeptidase [Mycoplasmoidaceae bacterium]
MKKNLLLMPAILALTPLASCATNQVSLANTVKNLEILDKDVNEEEQQDSCTFVYVGKDVSADGMPMMCRCADMGTTTETHLKVYQRDELANNTFVGKNGFTWTLPKHTAKCVVAPSSPLTNWGPVCDEMGLNEYGVVISSTLTCATNDDAKDPSKGGIPFVSNGIAEETITHAIIPSVKTAREGVQLLIDIIAREDKGNAGAEAVFIGDPNECWYVELYNGHRAVGVKLPDDKMFVQGNEFSIRTLDKFSDFIATPGYDAGDFIVKHDGKVDLFDSYARALTGSEAGRVTNDNSHRRTWRGLNLFGPDEYRSKTVGYSSTTQYESIFKPVFKPGMTSVSDDVKLTVDDVIGIYRDEFKDILEDETDPNHNAFLLDKQNHVLRTIACNRTGQTHILRINPNVDTSMAAQAWISLSPAKYAPFIPITAGMNSISDVYSILSDDNHYIENSAYWSYRKLNSLANAMEDQEKFPNFDDPEHEGESLVTKAINIYEDIWQQEFFHINDYASDIKNESVRNAFMTNYCSAVQNEAYSLSEGLIQDIETYLIEYNPTADPATSAQFYPLVDIKNFAGKYGYKYKDAKLGFNLVKDNDIFNIIMPDGLIGSKGQIKHNGEIVVDELNACYRNNLPYIDIAQAVGVFGQEQIAPIDFNMYLPHSNNHSNILAWLLPTIFGGLALIGAGIGCYFIIKKKKANINKSVNNTL